MIAAVIGIWETGSEGSGFDMIDQSTNQQRKEKEYGKK
jgi:hypothetical protein